MRSRLIFSHILPILVIIPVVGVGLIYLLETQVLLANIASELTRQAVLVADIAGGYTEIWYDPVRAQTFVRQVSPRVTAKVMLLDPTGRLLVSSDPEDSPLIGQVIQQTLNRPTGGDTDAQINYHQSEITDVVVPVVTSEGDLIGYVKLVNPLASVYERSQALRRVTIWVLAGGLLLGIVLALILAADLARPLRRATQIVLDLANNQYLAPPLLQANKEQGPTEIRVMTRAVNTLSERLQTMEESRRRLLANLVHELGTPLGALKSAIQALLGGAAEDVGFRQELLQGMDGELDRLQTLLNDLAHLHDQVLGSLELSLRPVAMSEWLCQLTGAWRAAAQEKGLIWDALIPDDLPTLQVDPDRFGQAVGNLINNAIRYSPSGHRVFVEAGVKEGRLFIAIDDTGSGVQAEERERIFTPFFRGKASGRFSQGMGLGLSIARDIVSAHAGELTLEPKDTPGSRFVIYLPLSS